LQPLFVSKRDEIFAAFSRLGMTPPYGHALHLLSKGPMRMRDIADQMACDASYVTALVDGLERSGFAVRQASTTDRRVKEIALTSRGQAAAAEMEQVMSKPPDVLLELSAADRKTLTTVLGKLKQGPVTSMWVKPTPPR
jgi:DNA-binding MarR family transcriptional regulator